MLCSEKKKQESLIEEYTSLANQTANIYNESYRNLCNALLTASSIYMAVIVAIAPSREAGTYSNCPTWLVKTSVVAFLISIICGIISHMRSVHNSRKMYEAYKKVAESLTNSNAEEEFKEASKLYTKLVKGTNDKINAIAQLVFFLIGMSCAVLLLFMAL